MYLWIKNNWKDVKEVIKPYKGKLVILILVEFVCMALSIIVPLLNMKVINVFVYEKVSAKHAISVLVYLLFFVCSAFLGYISSIWKRRLDLQMIEGIQRKVIEYSLSKGREEYEVNELGELDATLKMDVPMFQEFIMKYILDYPLLLFRLIGIGIIICFQSYEVAIVLGVVQFIVAIVRRKSYKGLDTQSIAVRTKYAKLNEVTSDIVSKSAYIESLGAAKYIFQRFQSAYGKYIGSVVRHIKFGTGISLIVEFARNICLIAVLGIGSYKIYNGNLSVGAFLSLIQYMGYLFGAFTMLSNYIVEMHSESRNIDNVLMKMRGRNEIKKRNNNETISANLQKVSLKEVSFAYSQGGNILEGVSAEFERGGVNCILGPSGAGKSTLLKLMLGLYNLESGEIYGITVNGIRVALKDYISFVPQENVFFTDTIYNNIVLGRDVEEDYVYEVCKECSIYEDILDLENGFDTVISNGILNFSGGQIKRLSIARAIIQNKGVLLVDEPTVGLDKENVNKVMECIVKYAKEKVVVVITHDKMVEKEADRIFMLADKMLIERASCRGEDVIHTFSK